MFVAAEPAVARNFKEIGPFSRIRNEDATQNIARVRRDVIGEGKRDGNDVLVQEVDVVALGIRRVIVERQEAREHSVLYHELALRLA